MKQRRHINTHPLIKLRHYTCWFQSSHVSYSERHGCNILLHFMVWFRTPSEFSVHCPHRYIIQTYICMFLMLFSRWAGLFLQQHSPLCLNGCSLKLWLVRCCRRLVKINMDFPDPSVALLPFLHPPHSFLLQFLVTSRFLHPPCSFCVSSLNPPIRLHMTWIT